MSWVGMSCLFTIQILIKITILKMMALHSALVCDSENWCTFFPVVCCIYVFDQTLAATVTKVCGLRPSVLTCSTPRGSSVFSKTCNMGAVQIMGDGGSLDTGFYHREPRFLL